MAPSAAPRPFPRAQHPQTAPEPHPSYERTLQESAGSRHATAGAQAEKRLGDAKGNVSQPSPPFRGPRRLSRGTLGDKRSPSSSAQAGHRPAASFTGIKRSAPARGQPQPPRRHPPSQPAPARSCRTSQTAAGAGTGALAQAQAKPR